MTAVCVEVLRAAHGALQLATSDGLPSLASATLYRTARELFDLFRAVVTHVHALTHMHACAHTHMHSHTCAHARLLDECIPR